MNGYRVDPQTLRAAAGQIADAIGGADKLELEKIAEKGEVFGNDTVSGSLAAFCTTWELAKGILQQRSASAGEALDSAATAYENREDQNTMPQPSPSPGPAPQEVP